jgi:hypothetical protein
MTIFVETAGGVAGTTFLRLPPDTRVFEVVSHVYPECAETGVRGQLVSASLLGDDHSVAATLDLRNTLSAAGVRDGSTVLITMTPTSLGDEAGSDARYGSFRGLLERAVPALALDDVDDGVITRALVCFPHQVLAATANGDAEAARIVYESTRMLPATDTRAELSSCLRIVVGAPLPHSSNLLVCFRDDVPMVLKPLTEDEWNRAGAFHAALAGGSIPHLTPFELVEAGVQRFMLMPRYIDTLATYERLTDAGVARLWQQLRDVVEGIHALGFAHMDIKPSNVCVTASADFFLIDVGSVAPVGSRTHATPSYLPCELQPTRFTNQTTAAAYLTDWWMLARTLCEKSGSARLSAGSATIWTQAELRAEVALRLPPPVQAELQSRLA